MVHHPHFRVRTCCHRHRLETDGHRARVREIAARRLDREDLEPVVGGVDGEQPCARRRERKRADLTALERDERCVRDGSSEQQTEQCNAAPQTHTTPDGCLDHGSLLPVPISTDVYPRLAPAQHPSDHSRNAQARGPSCLTNGTPVSRSWLAVLLDYA